MQIIWPVATAQILSLVGTILVTVWMSHYHDGFKWRYHDARKFNFHPMLMAIGFIFLSPKAAYVYRFIPFVKKKWVKIIHFLLQLSALLFATVGLVAVIEFHNDFGFKNFYSVHSWCGLATFGLFALQLVGGFFSFLFPKLPDGLRAEALKWHTFFGNGITIMIFMTTILGVSRKVGFGNFSSLTGEQVLANCLTLVLIVHLGLILFLIKPQKERSSKLHESL